ncbi:hypothetical protein ACO0QE_001378 [Hanseniaspora vineae]
MNEKKLQRIFYKCAAALIVLFFIGFLIVLPLDVIAQCSKNSVFDTFIAVGGMVLIGVFGLFYILGRVLIHRKHLQNIPKAYIPLLQTDIPNKNVWTLIWGDLKLTNQLSTFFMKPDRAIIHDGLSPPEYLYKEHNRLAKSCTDSDLFADKITIDSETTGSSTKSQTDTSLVFDDLPPSTNYEAVLKVLFDKLKYEGTLSNSFNIKNEDFLGITFEEYINKIKKRVQQFNFRDMNMFSPAVSRESFLYAKHEDPSDDFLKNDMSFDFDEYLALYHKLRFSGKPITCKDFKKFLDLTLRLFKIYAVNFTSADQDSKRDDSSEATSWNDESNIFRTDTGSSVASESDASVHSLTSSRTSGESPGTHVQPIHQRSAIHGYYPSTMPRTANMSPLYSTNTGYSFESVRKRF